MAADRQRLAQALAAEAARRKMFESIPEAAGQGLPQAPERPMGWNDYLENLSIGLGRGAVNNLEGIKGMVTSPVESLKGVATGVAEAVRNPRMVAEALKQTGQRAMSGPLGLGEVIGENVNMMRVPGKPVMHELDVYHGTPHRFPATEANPLGEFDASKIGTGEGSQIYGHGLYMAESPDVADSYRENLSDEAGYFYKADLPDEMIDRMLDWDKPLSEQPARVRKLFPSLDEAKAVNAELEHLGKIASADEDNLLKQKAWDALYKSPRYKLAEFVINEGKTEFKEKVATGRELYKAFGGGNDKVSSETLRFLGIPGIRYLDANSRDSGSGTRNFVVFPGEEKKVRILERK